MFSRLILPATIVILIATIFINPFNTKSNKTLKDFQGQWAGDYKDSSILLKNVENQLIQFTIYFIKIPVYFLIYFVTTQKS